jgi:hypothetical protein
MDPTVWLVASAVLVVAVAGAALAPRWSRDNLRRQLDGGGGSLSGIGAGFDVVWRPSAEEAREQWESQIEVPAPAPAPGDPGRMRDGRITLDLTD